MASEAIWEKICLVDTENQSGSLYAGTSVNGTKILEFNTIDLEPPFSAQRYLEAISVAKEAGIEFLVIDSLSHAWAGEGGLLELQGNIAKRTGNSYTAWRDVTPQHNKLVEAILQSDMHIAITMRTKTEYLIEENERGKKAPKKVGTAPIFRDGIEYEVTTFFDLGIDHMASVTKDRTMLFDGRIFQITPETGTQIFGWLNSGGDPLPPPSMNKTKPDTTQQPLAQRVDALIMARCKDLDTEEKDKVALEIKAITGGVANYRNITDESILRQLYDHFKEDSV